MRWCRRAREAMMIRAIVLTMLLATALPVAAQSRDDYLRRVDTDGDGRVSVSEYQFHMSFAFRQMDRNNDQILEPEEQLVPNAKTLTRAELDASMAAQFHRQDRNRDGYLNATELSAPPQL
jgi:Ca2+-binding EF-hand superfamily protein